ncbi:nucleotidyltransferase family protein [Candidatus Woesearchaeota archaeon]|nr:nucleotidyltransferase family protein [Candidatus Woesearchaeota archaeon]
MKEDISKRELIAIIKNELWLIDLLNVVRDLNMPDSYIAAGAIRNTVWDVLHEYEYRTPLNDVDVIYYNKKDINLKTDIQIYNILKEKRQKINWNVFNQARSHLYNNKRQQPESTADSVRYWSETPTCIGARLKKDDTFTICAPHGLNDLMNLIVRPVPEPYTDIKLFKERIGEKRWRETWPRLRIYES